MSSNQIFSNLNTGTKYHQIATYNLLVNQPVTTGPNSAILYTELGSTIQGLVYGGAGGFVVNEPMVLIVHITVAFGVSAVGQRGIIIQTFSVEEAKQCIDSASVGGTCMSSGAILSLAPGDIISLVANQNSGGDLDLLANFTRAQIFRLI